MEAKLGELLPDGEVLTAERLVVLEHGYDHYWRFHLDEKAWVKWCPICKWIHKA